MQRNFSFSVDEYYHIYNRGTDKRIIFGNKNDYNRFMTLLYLCNNTMPIDISNLIRGGLSFTELMDIKVNEKLVDIGAYCLMPNHFHLFVREKRENGISLFMKKLLTAYSMYFNKKHKRTGGLFEGPFLATHVDTDEYLKYMLSYIHLNPVKIIDSKWKENGIMDRVKAKKYLSTYVYSSYLDYMNINRKEERILNKVAFPEYFTNFQEFEHFISEWLSFSTKSKSPSLVKHPVKDSPPRGL
ncbi:MAG: Transposase [Parcubacteria group bacterium GW2011_GWF2_38_8]|nr:MAG: Transposase [Parcubacteria group bacterium GW2011_GWF2_38_8]